MRQIFRGTLRTDARLVSRMNDAGHILAVGQVIGDGQGVAAVLPHPQRQGFDALDERVCVERRHWRAKVAQQRDPHLQYIGDRTNRLGGLGPDGAVVGRVGCVQRRLTARVGFPVEVAAIDDDAADRGPVAADILGRGIDHHGRSMVERTHEQRGSCVVHDQRHAEGPADRCDFGDGECDQLRVRQRFGVIGSGAIVGGASERVGIIRIDEPRFDPLVLQCVGEQVPGAAIEVGRADDTVARARRILYQENADAAQPDPEGGGAATPPSIAASRCSRTSLVGFMIRRCRRCRVP